MLFAYGTLTLSEETIAMNRLVLGECDRFPEVAATFMRWPSRGRPRPWLAGCVGNANAG
jgi:hypothetical protein